MWLDWLFVCDCGFSLSALWCPLSVPTVLLGFLLPWTWGISSRLLQQSTATAPYLGHAVAPLCCAWDAVSFGFTLYVITIRVSNQDYVSFLTLVRKIFKFKRNLNSKDIFFFKIWTNLPEKWSLGAAASMFWQLHLFLPWLLVSLGFFFFSCFNLVSCFS